MARPIRIDFPGALFHVIARGNQRQCTFREDADYAKYERLLERYHQRYSFTLYAYVLMPNHVHLLLETGRHPLAKVMQGIQQSYTAHFNKRYRLVGHCFQGRYKAILCDRDAYLLTLIRYLHRNPVRAGLVNDPAGWRWSSHGAYLGRRPCGWVAAATVLAQFEGGARQARLAYLRFLSAGQDESHREDLYALVEQRYLGGEQFVGAAERKARSVPDRPRLRLKVEECIHAVADCLEVEPAALRTANRSGRLPLARALVAYLGRELAGIPYVETARALRRAGVTLTLQVQRLLSRRDRDPSVAEMISRAERLIRNKGRKA